MFFKIVNEQKLDVIARWPIAGGGLLANKCEGGGRDADAVSLAGNFLGIGGKRVRPRIVRVIVGGLGQNGINQGHRPI
jgi:hypothetical protein